MVWKRLGQLVWVIIATAAGAYLTRWALAAHGTGALFALLANWLVMSWVALVRWAIPLWLPPAY